MQVQRLLKGTTRVVLALGRHQDKNEPKNMGKIAELADEPEHAIQRGLKNAEDRGLIEKEREHPATYLLLTETGEEVYEHLEEIQDLVRVEQ